MLKKVEKSIFLTKPIIGVVGRKENNYYKINDSIYKMIINFDAVPLLLLPNNLDTFLNICDGVIIPGGNDINNYDIYVCNYCIEKDIPLLGICLGMQVMASLKDDNLILNKENHKDVTHKIITKKDSIIGRIVGDSYVNSRHNYHVSKIEGYNITAHSKDGYIEAIERNNNRFIVGVQWHPEDMIDYDEKQKNLIKEFISATKN